MKRICVFLVSAFMFLALSSQARAAGFTDIKHVFIIVFENHDWNMVKYAPYISSILKDGAHAEQYYNPPGIHPSEPNYIWLEAGDNFNIWDDNPPAINHISSTAHLVTQLKNAGISWKTYAEDISGNDCPIMNVNKFATKHVGMLFFEDVVGNPPTKSNQYCRDHIRPYSELEQDLKNNSAARYSFITPNLCNDMHDCSVATGDAWLSKELPKILSSQAYKDGAVFITFDEGGKWDGPIGMIVLSPFAKRGYFNNIHYTHSSTLRTFQEIFGVQPFLGDAKNAFDLGDMFSFKEVTAQAKQTSGDISMTPVPGRSPQIHTGLLDWLAQFVKSILKLR